jgi:glycosyltransferase involved in cell wall biosynthesis
MRTFMESGVPRDKLAKIPYGVDLSIFRPEPKMDNVFRVLFVGSAGVRKGLGYLLRAFANLDLPNFELMIVGGFAPDAKPVLEKLADITKFNYVGFVPRHQLRKTYSQGSVLVLPSILEGLALVQAQAMACGLPVIATANAGAEDLFTDGVEGFIIPPRDPAAIRDKVLLLYHDPDLRERMGNAALLRVRTLGGWESYGNGIAAAYHELLNGPNALPKATSRHENP